MSLDLVALLSKVNTSWWICAFLAAISGAYFLGTASIAKGHRERLLRHEAIDTVHTAQLDACKNVCRPGGSEALPAQIVEKTTNFRLHPLRDSHLEERKIKPQANLLAIPVGIKQKKVVDRIVTKFLLSDFLVMLFHYDGVVDKWNDLAWSDRVIHVAAMSQTKWWFAKRFLHPDVVADYDHIFLWDEDIGVENFSPKRYLSIINEEGLEISQPALDPVKSYRVHHGITARKPKSRVHRRMHKFSGSGRCYDNSTAPPCTGWVELMVPVFTQKAWRCAWHMIQNDLIHAWGLDKQLGYCSQGDRVKNIGVVDSEYVVHLGLPTLGASYGDKVSKEALIFPSMTRHSLSSTTQAQSQSSSPPTDFRSAVREQSSLEMKMFQKRWSDAVKEDQCWTDPYQNTTNDHS
uniref:Uncharacterized protein n=1 Tax=Kalanchoe fedtschenkoi TaxID=63787 RepID=A0A7N0TLB4_KALFE